MEYRGFTIQENKMKYVYGNQKWEVTNYLVYKEDNGEKYFLPSVTAFDSIDTGNGLFIALVVIDDMVKREE